MIGEKDELDEYLKLVKLPVRIPASRFKDFLKKPDEVAQSYRRPMPEKPYTATMQGTLFHSWVEARYGIISNSDQIDDISVDEVEDNSTFAFSAASFKRCKAIGS